MDDEYNLFEVGGRVRLKSSAQFFSGEVGKPEKENSYFLPEGVVGTILGNDSAPKTYWVHFDHDDADKETPIEGYMLEVIGE